MLTRSQKVKFGEQPFKSYKTLPDHLSSGASVRPHVIKERVAQGKSPQKKVRNEKTQTGRVYEKHLEHKELLEERTKQRTAKCLPKFSQCGNKSPCDCMKNTWQELVLDEIEQGMDDLDQIEEWIALYGNDILEGIAAKKEEIKNRKDLALDYNLCTRHLQCSYDIIHERDAEVMAKLEKKMKEFGIHPLSK